MRLLYKSLFCEDKPFIPVLSSGPDSYVVVDGKRKINLASNNYLGFATDPIIRKTAINAIKKWGVGTASVRSLIGTNTLHTTLEKKLSEFKKTEDTLLVTSGYLANMAVIQTIMRKDDIVVSDELNHASIIDAIRLSGVRNRIIYTHSNMEDLNKKLSNKELSTKGRRILIVTDGVFSMDGDLARLPELAQIAKTHNALLMVDDAHGEGVLGRGGRGIVDHFRLHGKVDIEVGTLSKAFGVNGGFISGKAGFINYLRKYARQFIFTNALSIPDTASLIVVVEELLRSTKRIKILLNNAEYLKKSLAQAGFDIGRSQTPITPLMIGNENTTREYASILLQKGIYVTAITYPMVAQGSARIRLIPSALHTKNDLDKAVKVLIKVAREKGIIN